MNTTATRIKHGLLAGALGFIVSIRITCEWLEPRMVCRLKRIMAGVAS